MFFGLIGFEERNDNDMLPNVGDSGVGIGQVGKPAQIAQAQGTTMLQLKQCQTVKTESSGAATVLQHLLHLVGVERHRAIIHFLFILELADDDSGCRVVSMGSGSGELLYEFCCKYFSVSTIQF